MYHEAFAGWVRLLGICAFPHVPPIGASLVRKVAERQYSIYVWIVLIEVGEVRFL